MESCPICNQNIEWFSLGGRDSIGVRCPQCGCYEITRSALVNLRNTDLSDRQRANISGWLNENEMFEINTYNLDDFLVKLRSPSFLGRADNLLGYIAEKSQNSGVFVLYDSHFLSYSYSASEVELDAVIEYLIESNMIRVEGGENFLEKEFKLAPGGWIRLDELLKNNEKSSQGFVAMWFDESIRHLYDDAIAPAISDAGYKPHRVDLREHNDKIDDEIISQIRKSKFVVADFTGHRGGVYFEAGFAKGLGLEVFWLCREDDLENLHFDIRQYNCIVWTDANKEELRKRLSTRIESVLGSGLGSST